MAHLSDHYNSLICKTIEEVIEKQSKSKNGNILVQCASGDNMMGVINRIFFGSQENRDDFRTIIVKSAPRCTLGREFFNIRKHFLREAYFYNEVFPYYREFQESKGIAIESNGFHQYPKCYKTIDKEFDECLILADLKKNNFLALDRHSKKLTNEHVCKVMQALGEFHAISFALKDQQPEKFKTYSSNIKQIMHSDTERSRQLHNMVAREAMESVSGAADSKLLERFMKCYEKGYLDIAIECLCEAEPKAVISHGDYWINNIMFKYDSERRPIDVCLMDWQLSFYASPACDIVHFVFGGTEKEFRNKHYHTWLKVYHDSLTSLLNRLGSDAEKIFSYDDLLDQLRKYGKYGLVIATIQLHFHTTQRMLDLDKSAEEFLRNLNTEAQTFDEGQPNEVFLKRMRDVIIDMIDLEYI